MTFCLQYLVVCKDYLSIFDCFFEPPHKKEKKEPLLSLVCLCLLIPLVVIFSIDDAF